MAMSKRTELATARRRLHQIEQQQSASCIHTADMTQTERRRAEEYLRELLESQRKRVERLEAELHES